MAVTLTSLPLPWTVAPKLLDFGVDQTAGAGGSGAQQRSTRIGSRWAVAFSALPALGPGAARKLIASRLAAQAAGSTVITNWPQPAFATAIGAPVVDGAGQGGGSLAVRGLTAGVALASGLFLSVAAAGRNFLYITADTALADGTGRAVLTIAPWIRAAPADGASLAFASPQVEGFITPAGLAWTLDRLAWTGLPAFTITEVA